MAVALTAAVVMSQSVMVYAIEYNPNEKQTKTVTAVNQEKAANEGVEVTGENSSTYGVNATSENGTASVTVEKGVSATSNNNEMNTTRTVAINASSSGSEAKTEVIVNSGDTTATGTVTGTATENRIADATGIDTSAGQGGTVNVSTGTVTATTNKGTARGITVSTGDSEDNVNISTGALTASSGSGTASGIEVSSYGGNISITTGTVEASGNKETTGINAIISGSTILNETVNGDVNASGTGIQLATSGNNVGAKIIVTNDVIAEDTAISLNKVKEQQQEQQESGSSVTIEVDGTISGKEHNIVIEKNGTTEALTVEVWKVDTSNDKAVIEKKIGYNAYEDITGTEIGINTINYIIKVDGSNLTPDARTAREGENVTLRVDVPSGYSIDSFYTAQGGTAVNVLQDSSGNYYIVVPRGGGVYVGVRLRSNGTSESSDRGDDNYRATSGGDSSVPNVNVGPKTVKVNGVEQKNDIHVASVSAEMKDAFAATLSTFAATGMVDLGGNNVSVPENAQIKDSFTFTADNAIGLVTAYIEFKNYKEGDIILCSYMDANGVLITVALTPDEIQNGAVILTLPAQCTLALAGSAGPVMGPLA